MFIKMKSKELNNLNPEEKQEEIEKCKSFEYFYNNYCRIKGMPEYSEQAYQDYLEMAQNARFMTGRTRGGKALCMRKYPLTHE